MKLEKLFEEAVKEAIKETFGGIESIEELKLLAFVSQFLEKANKDFEANKISAFCSGAMSMLVSLKDSGFLKDCYEDLDLEELFKLEENDDVRKRAD